MTHEAVSTAYPRHQAAGNRGRALAPPLTVSEAAGRLIAASGVKDKHNAVIEVANALVREPSMARAIALARMAEVARHGGMRELAEWLDLKVDRVCLESQRILIEETTRLALTAFEKEVTNLQSTGGKS